jgi:CRP/FNR family transcriptional regulator, cyclic AMP receptor protein
VAPNKVDTLRKVPLFSHCSTRELEFLSTRMDEVTLNPGRVLIEEGQPTESFFVLLAGEVEVSRKGRPVRRMARGDFFGEIGMLDRGSATATVKTTEATEALVMSHAQFRDAIKANDTLALKVITAMAERLRATDLA